MTGEDLSNLFQSYVEAINSHDVDRVLSCYGDDAVLEDALAGTLQGKNELRSYFSTLFSAFPDLSYDVENVLAADDLVATEAAMSGTHKGPFPPFEECGVTGKSMSLSCAVFYDLKDGKFSAEGIYCDYGSLVAQLGFGEEQSKAA